MFSFAGLFCDIVHLLAVSSERAGAVSVMLTGASAGPGI